ncbi:putative caffeine synthase 2 [Glycine max]|nr:putative caffeine synthase 2 [Glycine max]
MQVPPALYDEHKRPLNKGCVYICESSPEVVSQAYYHQFQEDFSLFLRSRSEELVVGGRMVLIFLGRRGPEHVDRGNSFFWEILSRSFAILVSQGEIEQEKFDSYDAHFYAPSREEIEEEVRKEGSLKMERLEMFEMDKSNNEQESSESYGTQVAVAVRAIQESMISHHFGEGILESLFENYARLVDEEMAKEDIRPISFVLVLRKI